MRRAECFLLVIFSVFILGLFWQKEAWGAEKEEGIPEISSEYVADIQKYLDSCLEMKNFSFQELAQNLLSGNFNQALRQIGEAIEDSLFQEIRGNGKLAGQILALGIIGGVFTNFSSAFGKSQISEAGFFVTYLLLYTCLAASFFTSITVAAEIVDRSLGFMKVLMPVCFLAAAFAGGSLSAIASYEFTLAAIAAAQWICGSFLIPVVRMYGLLVMAGHISREDVLSKLTDLLSQGVSWILKTLVGVVLGVHLLQSMVLPYVDSMKTGAVQKLIGVIPGIGQGADALAQMVIGSGVLIKNTIGAAGIVVLAILTVIPVLKLVILMVLYQCTAAILQPICDKRLVSCISDMARGHKLLLSVSVSVILLFVITVGVVCASGNVVYYAV